MKHALGIREAFHGRSAVRALLGVGTFLGCWEAYVAFSGVSSLILPAPSRVLYVAASSRQVLLENALPTLSTTVLGFALSMSAAFALSVALYTKSTLRSFVMPLAVISQTLPLPAIAPLVVLWFGFEIAPKVFLVALITFFPMLIAWLEGYDATDRELIKLLRSMGATRWQVFYYARLATALPYFFAGLRIAITYGVVATVFAEYVGARAGLGIVILNAKNSFRPDLMLAAVAVTSALTLLLFGLATVLQWLALRWRNMGAAHE